jgi:hypothetical protein
MCNLAHRDLTAQVKIWPVISTSHEPQATCPEAPTPHKASISCRFKQDLGMQVRAKASPGSCTPPWRKTIQDGLASTGAPSRSGEFISKTATCSPARSAAFLPIRVAPGAAKQRAFSILYTVALRSEQAGCRSCSCSGNGAFSTARLLSCGHMEAQGKARNKVT